VQKTDSLENLLNQISSEIYEKIKSAIELGKWDDGSNLSRDQLENCMQLLILYEARKFPKNSRTGRKLNSCSIDEDPISIQSLVGGKQK
tara:strand:- start:606 stop:872 length:267 start_codon:yes stop_codon:yes gene_type:complete